MRSLAKVQWKPKFDEFIFY